MRRIVTIHTRVVRVVRRIPVTVRYSRPIIKLR